MLKIRYLGREIEYEECYRPDQIKVDGKVMSMSLHAERHGYNWESKPGGNLLCYEADDGSRFAVPQQKLSDGAREENSKIKKAREQAGLSRAAVARATHIPVRTLEDWEAGRRTPKQGEDYWVTVVKALGYMTKEGLAALTAGDISLEEALAMGKHENVRRLSQFGAYSDTFHRAWSQLPDKAIDVLDAQTLAELVDVIVRAKEGNDNDCQ